MSSVIPLSIDEIDDVSGGVDHEVIAAGLGIMVGSLSVGLACPAAGGAIATIGLAVVVSGLLS